MEISNGMLVTLYVILLGPLKLIGPFATATANADRELRRRIINRAFVMSTVVAVVFAGIGGFVMSRFNLSIGVLAITMGVFLGHWAVGNALAPPGPGPTPPDEPTIELAAFPISMPGIVPPQAIALLILSVDLVIETRVVNGLPYIMLLILMVMALNWLCMLVIPSLMRYLGPVFWRMLSRTTAVIISAIALQIIVFGLRDLGMV